MDGLEEKLGAVLSNPQMMQQLMTMAQALSAQAPKKEAPADPPPAPAPSPGPDIDLGALQKLIAFARQGNIDKDQQALLKALGPFLSKDRIFKLEKAMRAAKMAQFASAAFGQKGFPF